MESRITRVNGTNSSLEYCLCVSLSHKQKINCKQSKQKKTKLMNIIPSKQKINHSPFQYIIIQSHRMSNIKMYPQINLQYM